MSRKISRRTVLKGAGAAMALPWLETMASGATDANRLTEPPLRMVFMYMPNGVVPEYWTPPGDGEDYELTPHLKPLAGLKSEFLLLENLWNAKTVGRNGHWPKVPAWLSAAAMWSAPRATIWIRAAPRSISSRRRRSATAPCCPASSSGWTPPAPASTPPAAASRACTAASFRGATRTPRCPKRSCRNSPSTASSAPTKRRSYRA